jgi:hypothetical protein
MKKFLLSCLLILLFISAINAQKSIGEFDTLLFGQNIKIAGRLVENDYVNEIALDFLNQKQEQHPLHSFCYETDNQWYFITGIFRDGTYEITRKLVIDTLYNVTECPEKHDTDKLEASLSAIMKSESQFQVIRDTSSIYFSSFVYHNTDQSISVWFLPKLQPSGQALYGSEWEYVFDRTGKSLLMINSLTNPVKGVWLGQPREFWLNYRNQESPTVGSLYFALSFRDFFSRIRIDTRFFINTLEKSSEGKYTWTHRKK